MSLILMDAQISKFPDFVQEIHGSFELKSLNLGNCNISDENFLVTPFSFPLLQSLDLSGNKFVTLPSVHKLYKLSDFSLENCQRLGEIPELPKRWIKVKASHCNSLVDTPWKIMATIISNNTGFLNDSEIEIAIPGSDILNWFSHKSVGESSVTLDVPLNMMKNVAAVIICAVFRSRDTIWATELSFELLHESDSHVGSLRRHNIVTEPGNMWLIYLPARTLLSGCIPFSPSKDTKLSVLKKINHVNKINVSFGNWSSISRCGIHVLWDGDEVVIEGKPPIKVSDSISHIVYRTFDDFANGGTQCSRNLPQKRTSVSGSTSIFEIEEMEEQELPNISKTESIEEEELADISVSEDMEELTTKKMFSCCFCFKK